MLDRSSRRKNLKPLIPGAKRGKWRDSGGILSSGDDAEFVVRRGSAINRDGGKCQFCGVAMSTMHVHHIDDDHSNNEISNYLTTDSLCHSVNHIGLLGDAAVMAYFPALSQVDLIHLLRAVVVVIARGGDEAEEAKRLAKHLFESYKKPIEETFGSSKARDFGNALLQLEDSDYESRAMALRDARVMFDTSQMSKLSKDIAQSLYPNSPSDILPEWKRIADGIDAQAQEDLLS